MHNITHVPPFGGASEPDLGITGELTPPTRSDGGGRMVTAVNPFAQPPRKLKNHGESAWC
jgi:hypothetical protein